jgi:hypothetical protein
MKKLARMLDNAADCSMVELTKWTRQVLYDFVIDFVGEMLQNEEDRINR